MHHSSWLQWFEYLFTCINLQFRISIFAKSSDYLDHSLRYFVRDIFASLVDETQNDVHVPGLGKRVPLGENGSLEDDFFSHGNKRFFEMTHEVVYDLLSNVFVAHGEEQLYGTLADADVRVLERQLDGAQLLLDLVVSQSRSHLGHPL